MFMYFVRRSACKFIRASGHENMFKLVMNYFNERLSSKAPIQREEETIFIIYRYKADNQLVRCLRPWILRIILEYVTSDKERGEEKRTILWLKFE